MATLKQNIYDAFVKNLTPDNPAPDFEMSADGKKKVDTLAEDLTKAIRDFILAQTFRVDKLSAPVLQGTIDGVNGGAPIPAAGPPGAPLIAPGTPITLAGITGFSIETTADVDVNGLAENGSLDAKDKSDSSEVRLREDQVKADGLPKG